MERQVHHPVVAAIQPPVATELGQCAARDLTVTVLANERWNHAQATEATETT